MVEGAIHFFSVDSSAVRSALSSFIRKAFSDSHLLPELIFKAMLLIGRKVRECRVLAPVLVSFFVRRDVIFDATDPRFVLVHFAVSLPPSLTNFLLPLELFHLEKKHPLTGITRDSSRVRLIS